MQKRYTYLYLVGGLAKVPYPRRQSIPAQRRTSWQINGYNHWMGTNAKRNHPPVVMCTNKYNHGARGCQMYWSERWIWSARCRILGRNVVSLDERKAAMCVGRYGPRYKMCWYLAKKGRRTASRVSISSGERVLSRICRCGGGLGCRRWRAEERHVMCSNGHRCSCSKNSTNDARKAKQSQLPEW